MFVAEVIGTATLLFIGCMSNVGTLGAAPPTSIQTTFAFGLTVNLLIMVSSLQLRYLFIYSFTLVGTCP